MRRFIDKCANLTGPLSFDAKRRLFAVLRMPSQETWDNVARIIIAPEGMKTLWKAVIDVDPSFPRSGPLIDEKGHCLQRWGRVPDSFTIARAIKQAVQAV